MIRAIAALICSLAVACGAGSAPVGPAQPSPPTSVRVLVVTATAGFRHDSIPQAITVLRSLAPDIAVTATEDVSTLSADALSRYDVVMFTLTTGELPLTVTAKSALLDFVSSGRGFIGIHSATDTLYEWPDYGRLIGAYFREHPWTQRGDVVVEERNHPATTGLDPRFSITEEFYAFRDNPRGRVQVLLSLDAASVGATGDYPLAWIQSFGAGRVYYNALGHFPETWNDARFQRQLAGAIRWTAGR